MGNEVNRILSSLKERDEILKNNGSIRKYNYYFDIIVKNTRKIILEGRQSELLYLLDYDNISYRRDMAGMLYNCYKEKCIEVLKEISEMSAESGLPIYYFNLSVSASMALEMGIPKDFP